MKHIKEKGKIGRFMEENPIQFHFCIEVNHG